MRLRSPNRPCAECPWRKDVAPGRFPPERFGEMAHTAADMDQRLFQCHRTSDDRPLVCAGFLARGADHNLTVRLARMRGDLEPQDEDSPPLYEDYREMAIANGVDPEDPVLDQCRSRRR